MSLILDALKRAERERRGDAGMAPAQAPAPAAGPPGRRRRAVPALAVVVGGLALSALLLWDAFREPSTGAPPPAAQPRQEPQPQVPPAASPPVVVARPAPSPATVVPGTEGVASLDDLTDEPVLEGAPPAVAPVPARPASKPAPATPAPAKPDPEPRAQEPPTIATTPVPPPTAAAPTEVGPQAPDAAAPASGIPPALTQPAPLRKLREMPPDYRADFPRLTVEIHVYEKDPQRRFVMINGRRYRAGERLAEGPALLEIVPEGMVLEHRGEKVLYTLGR